MTANCSKVRPLQKKDTNKSSSAFKYARDCYILNLFLKGDMTAQVDDIFSSRGNKHLPPETATSQQDGQTPSRYEIASAKLSIQNLRLEISELKMSHEGSTKKWHETINSLEQKNKSLTNSLQRIESELQAKVTQYDAKLKLISSVLKDLEQFNVHEVNTRLENLETSNKRLINTVNKMRSSPKSPRPQLLSWLKTYSCSVRVEVF